MPDTVLMAQAGTAALGLAFVILVACGWPWSTVSPRKRGIGATAAVGIGFFTGCWLLGLRPRWPATEDLDRFLLFLLPAAIVVEVVACFCRYRSRLSSALRFLIAGGVAPVLLHRTIYLADLAGPGSREWSSARAALILTGLALVGFTAWMSLLRLSDRTGSRTPVLSQSLVCAGTALTVMLSGYASGGQLGVPLAGALVGIFIATFVLQSPVNVPGALSIGVVGHFALLTIGHFFGQLTLTNALLLLAAPQLNWIGEISLLRSKPIWIRRTSQIVAVVLAIGAAVMLAQHKFAADSSSPTSNAGEPSINDYIN